MIAFFMLPNNCTIGKDVKDAIVTPKLAVLLTASVCMGIYDSTASIIGESLICMWRSITNSQISQYF